MLEFKPIDLVKHRDTCLRFREESFVVSFGSAERFLEKDGLGPQRYLAWLTEFIAADPMSCVHAWQDGAIVGQIESHVLKNEPKVGYVYLYYVAPEFRGKGISQALDGYTVAYFKKLGCTSMRLSVSPTNKRAWAFYEKCGWKDGGQRPQFPEVHLMEKRL